MEEYHNQRVRKKDTSALDAWPRPSMANATGSLKKKYLVIKEVLRKER